MKPQFAVISGPDSIHWQHTTTIHTSYKSALSAYNAIGGRDSAVIIRMDDKQWEPGRRTVKRQNQYNYGQAVAWCDEMNRRNGIGPTISFAACSGSAIGLR